MKSVEKFFFIWSRSLSGSLDVNFPGRQLSKIERVLPKLNLFFKVSKNVIEQVAMLMFSNQFLEIPFGFKK